MINEGTKKGKWHIKLAQLGLGQLRWVNCGKPKLGHINLKQITTFGQKTKVPFTNLIYYNTTKHESHTKQKEKSRWWSMWSIIIHDQKKS